MLHRSACNQSALYQSALYQPHLRQNHRRRGGNIERVRARCHGDPDAKVRIIHGPRAQPRPLRAKQKRNPLRPTHPRQISDLPSARLLTTPRRERDRRKPGASQLTHLPTPIPHHTERHAQRMPHRNPQRLSIQGITAPCREQHPRPPHTALQTGPHTALQTGPDATPLNRRLSPANIHHRRQAPNIPKDRAHIVMIREILEHHERPRPLDDPSRRHLPRPHSTRQHPAMDMKPHDLIKCLLRCREDRRPRWQPLQILC